MIPMQTLHDDTFGRIAGLMHEAIGLHLAPSKKTLVSSRLGPRMQKLGLATVRWLANDVRCLPVMTGQIS